MKWGSPEIYKSVNNIWKISEHGGKPVQVTHHTSGNLFFPSMSADGKTIVYEENFGLWKLDVATGKSTEIRVDIKSDAKENEVELVTIENEAQSFHLSPSTQARGDCDARRDFHHRDRSRRSAARDRDAVARGGSASGRRTGNGSRLFRIAPAARKSGSRTRLGHGLKKLSDADCDKPAIAWAPDSKSLLWSGSDHKLRRVEIASGKTDVVATSDVAAVGTPQFSPDGKWISYSKRDPLLRDHVYVKPVDGGDGTHDRRGRFSDFERREVDAGRQEACCCWAASARPRCRR